MRQPHQWVENALPELKRSPRALGIAVGEQFSSVGVRLGNEEDRTALVERVNGASPLRRKEFIRDMKETAPNLAALLRDIDDDGPGDDSVATSQRPICCNYPRILITQNPQKAPRHEPDAAAETVARRRWTAAPAPSRRRAPRRSRPSPPRPLRPRGRTRPGRELLRRGDTRTLEGSAADASWSCVGTVVRPTAANAPGARSSRRGAGSQPRRRPVALRSASRRRRAGCAGRRPLVRVLCTAAYAPSEASVVAFRPSLRLTIYNGVDLTLVQEYRTLVLRKGLNRIQYQWAGTLIDSTSLELRPRAQAGAIEVADVVSPKGAPATLVSRRCSRRYAARWSSSSQKISASCRA